MKNDLSLDKLVKPIMLFVKVLNIMLFLINDKRSWN